MAIFFNFSKWWPRHLSCADIITFFFLQNLKRKSPLAKMCRICTEFTKILHRIFTLCVQNFHFLVHHSDNPSHFSWYRAVLFSAAQIILVLSPFMVKVLRGSYRFYRACASPISKARETQTKLKSEGSGPNTSTICCWLLNDRPSPSFRQ